MKHRSDRGLSANQCSDDHELPTDSSAGKIIQPFLVYLKIKLFKILVINYLKVYLSHLIGGL